MSRHSRALATAVERMLDVGMELSQIRFAYNPKADYANVTLTPERGSVRIEWRLSTGDSKTTLASDLEDLEGIVMRLAAGEGQ